MLTRRTALIRSAQVALMLGGLGVLPKAAEAAYSTAAFEAKSVGDLMKALGAGAPVESADVTVTAPDIAENGAVVPVVASTTLPGAKRLLILVEKNPSMLSAAFDVSE
ncbi:MAG TPA: thiosulfate oxidation carrier protein SoxY, partial [Burkholderiaceae bacterium]|nr:thiosulfate oxidation carrier protein SoxY [Burkholderiaceae bacterium]